MDFFNELQDFFAGLVRTELLYLLGIGLLLFLIAFLLGLLIRGRSLKRYKKQVLLAERERADYEARYLAASEKEKALAREVEQLSREKVAALDALEDARNTHSAQTGVDNADWEAECTQQLQLITELQQEIARLQQSAQVVDLQSSRTDAAGAVSANGSADQLNAYLRAAEARFSSLEAKLTQLDGENARLENEVNNLRQGNNSSTGSSFNTPHQPIVGQPATDDNGEPLVIRADTTNPGIRTDHKGGMEVIVDRAASVQVPLFSPENNEHDNLQAIKNIGPFIEKELNAAGIYSYAQIAAWNDEDIDYYTTKIGYVPGLIKQNDWMGQAASLGGITPAATKKTSPAASPAPVAKTTDNSPPPVKATDLKVVEGIGPKIEKVLKESGIKNIGVLAIATPEQLAEILEKAGTRFKSHNPTTWPTQAELAKNEQWTELKILQDKLKGGTL